MSLTALRQQKFLTDACIKEVSICLPYLSQLLKDIIHIQTSIFPSIKLREVLISKRQKSVENHQHHENKLILTFPFKDLLQRLLKKSEEKPSQTEKKNSCPSLFPVRVVPLRPRVKRDGCFKHKDWPFSIDTQLKTQIQFNKPGCLVWDNKSIIQK